MSSAFELLPSWVLKEAFIVISELLLSMFRKSLSQGSFPDSWKNATVVPLHKGGPTREVGNYRPISLLPLPRKLLERIVHTHIMMFLESNRLLNVNQGGFRSGCSTANTISKLLMISFLA